MSLTQQFVGHASQHPTRVALTVRRNHEHVAVNARRDDGRGGGTRQDLPRGGKPLPHELGARALDPVPGDVEGIGLCLVKEVRIDAGRHAWRKWAFLIFDYRDEVDMRREAAREILGER